MTRATWDSLEQSQFETGVDHGILFPLENGVYQDGVPWSGLTTVTESPEGAEATPIYADNRKYLNLTSVETFKATIEALTFPDEFEACDGSAEMVPGVTIGQQNRQPFGFYYRTKVGNAGDPDAGVKHHFVYGCQVAPSEKAHATVNDTPEAMPFSWAVTTTPIDIGDYNGVEYKPTASLTVSSLQVDSDALDDLLDLVYGTDSSEPTMPMPSDIADLVGATVTVVNMNTSTNQPTYVAGTHIVTLPAVVGVQWKINGVVKSAGAQTALTTGQTSAITAAPLEGYALTGDRDWTFDY